MSNNGHNNQEIEKVIMMVQLVSASDKGDSNPPEGIPKWYLIPRYADRLAAIGLVGIQRCIQYDVTKNKPIYVDDIPKFTQRDEIISHSKCF